MLVLWNVLYTSSLLLIVYLSHVYCQEQLSHLKVLYFLYRSWLSVLVADHSNVLEGKLCDYSIIFYMIVFLHILCFVYFIVSCKAPEMIKKRQPPESKGKRWGVYISYTMIHC